MNDDPGCMGEIILADGGVYDDLGLGTVCNRCGTVHSSAAGAPFSTGPASERDWLHRTMRALEVATDQSRALRRRASISDIRSGRLAGAYWGIETDIAACGILDGLRCAPAWSASLSRIRTRPDPFDDEEQGSLINRGHALADAAMRRHTPRIVEGGPAPAWPQPSSASS